MDYSTNTTDLGTMYDNLKNGLNNTTKPLTIPVCSDIGADAWKAKALKCRDELVDNCRKRIIVDLYCHILPLDKEFIDNNKGLLANDVSNLLASKGMNATQYIQSSSDNTKSPMLEYIKYMTKLIGDEYMKEADEKLKDAKDKKIDIPEPEVPDVETNPEINDNIVDIEEYRDYDNFMDILKDKAKKQIVNDITKEIEDRQQSDEMKFDPKPVAEIEEQTESVTSIALHYINKQFMKENVEITESIQDEMIGLAIRESVINMMDKTLKMENSAFNECVTRIRSGKGIVVNDNSSSYLIESVKQDVDKVVDDANKDRDNKINSKLKASDVINNEEEKKKKEEDHIDNKRDWK